jgi:Ca-activated chloride channel family protein
MNPWRSLALTVAWAVPILVGFAMFYSWGIYTNAWDVVLARPWMLLLLPAAGAVYVIAWAAYHRYRAAPGASGAHLFVSRGADMARMPRGLRAQLLELPGALRVVAVVLLAGALARPQRVGASEALELSGIDIVIALDLSGSMRAADLAPTRLDAAKAVIIDFIQRRRTDRIGLVVFGREAFPALAPTLDKVALQQTVQDMAIGVLSDEMHSGTAIGDGLGTALNYLRRSDARSKVVVLLTDGANNAGRVDPNHAAQLATALNVRVYTILMGQSDTAPIVTGRDIFGRPVTQMAHFPVDPALLQSIASTTRGQFFRAADRASLEQAFHTILDRLERSRVADAGTRPSEKFYWLVVPALVLLALEVLLSATLLRRFP